MKDETPTIECRDIGRGQWAFYCQYCGTDHVHGAGEGHRVAHCHNSDSPCRKTGYYIKLED